MKRVLVLLLSFIVIGTIYAEPEPERLFTPELYLGWSMAEYGLSLGMGGSIGGGVRVGNRHYFGLDLTRIKAWEALDAFPETDELWGMRSSYYFSPVMITDLFRFETGFSLAYGSDEYYDYHGSWGVAARFAVGTKRIAWFGDGFVSNGFMQDLFGDFGRPRPSLFTVASGVRIGFGK